MPKLSLSRRHRRQTNLSAQWDDDDDDWVGVRFCSTCCITNSAARRTPAEEVTMSSLTRTTPRLVSDEDMLQQTSSSREDSGVTTASSTTITSKSTLQKSVLKRPLPSVCLVNLNVDLEDAVVVSRTPRPSSFSCHSSNVTQPNSPSSPWGHFVDLLVQDEVEHNVCGSPEYQVMEEESPMPRFVPCCPSPSKDNPYPIITKLSKRRRLPGSTTALPTRSTKLEGLVLYAPSVSTTTVTRTTTTRHTNAILDEARLKLGNVNLTDT